MPTSLVPSYTHAARQEEADNGSLCRLPVLPPCVEVGVSVRDSAPAYLA